MHSEKDSQAFIEALFNFKGGVYTYLFQQIGKTVQENKLSKEKKNEVFLKSLVDVASRFIIDLFDDLDHCSKDSLNEEDIPPFWKLAKKTIEKKMDQWLQETVKSSPYLTTQIAKLRSDIREFQERATKFHMERQAYTFTIRKQNEMTNS